MKSAINRRLFTSPFTCCFTDEIRRFVQAFHSRPAILQPFGRNGRQFPFNCGFVLMTLGRRTDQMSTGVSIFFIVRLTRKYVLASEERQIGKRKDFDGISQREDYVTKILHSSKFFRQSRKIHPFYSRVHAQSDDTTRQRINILTYRKRFMIVFYVDYLFLISTILLKR